MVTTETDLCSATHRDTNSPCPGVRRPKDIGQASIDRTLRARIHNLSVENQKIHDPDLTDYGRQQCRDLAKNFPHQEDVDLIVASPLRRTIYTALYTFESALAEKKLPPVLAQPELQETSEWICDVGTDIEILRTEMTGQPVDLSHVPDGWNSKTGQWAPDGQSLKERGRRARHWLRLRPEKHVVAVTHGGFLHYLTDNWSDYNEISRAS